MYNEGYVGNLTMMLEIGSAKNDKKKNKTSELKSDIEDGWTLFERIGERGNSRV